MAWRCTGASNAELIANLRSPGLISLDSVADVSPPSSPTSPHTGMLTRSSLQAMKAMSAHYTLDPRGACEDPPHRLAQHAMVAARLVGDAHPSPFIFPGYAPAVPAALVEQLARPGRMFVPVGPDGGAQVVMRVDKDADGVVTETRLMGMRYVPLTDPAGLEAELENGGYVDDQV
ncbi:hypothetical protein HWV62_38132 [Athelia sp. TMB]|nr:hypothetical protein HWV62_38132 [Athelia sp. TMB]